MGYTGAREEATDGWVTQRARRRRRCYGGKHVASKGGVGEAVDCTLLYCVLVTWQRELSEGEECDANQLSHELQIVIPSTDLG